MPANSPNVISFATIENWGLVQSIGLASINSSTPYDAATSAAASRNSRSGSLGCVDKKNYQVIYPMSSTRAPTSTYNSSFALSSFDVMVVPVLVVELWALACPFRTLHE